MEAYNATSRRTTACKFGCDSQEIKTEEAKKKEVRQPSTLLEASFMMNPIERGMACINQVDGETVIIFIHVGHDISSDRAAAGVVGYGSIWARYCTSCGGSNPSPNMSYMRLATFLVNDEPSIDYAQKATLLGGDETWLSSMEL